MQICLAHYGTPSLIDRGDETRTVHDDRLRGPIDLMRAHPNLYCDLAAYQHVIRAEDPFPFERALRIVQVMVEALGAERVLWGTDFPYLGQKPYPELIRAIREAPFLKAGESDLILGQNAWRIFSGRCA